MKVRAIVLAVGCSRIPIVRSAKIEVALTASRVDVPLSRIGIGMLRCVIAVTSSFDDFHVPVLSTPNECPITSGGIHRS